MTDAFALPLKRKPIKDGVFIVTAKLVIDRPTGTTELAESAPLVLADGWVANHTNEAGQNIAKWLNDLGERHSRTTRKGRK